MKMHPTLEECRELSCKGNYGVIPVSTEILSDATTPIEVLQILKKISAHVYLLESAEADKKWGRYSFLGYDHLLQRNHKDQEPVDDPDHHGGYPHLYPQHHPGKPQSPIGISAFLHRRPGGILFLRLY